MSIGDGDDLLERVRRLEAVVASLQAQLAAAPRGPAPTDPDPAELAAHAPVDLAASTEPVAAVVSPEPTPPLAVAALPPPNPVAASRPHEADALEAAIGTYWLSRIGIVALVTGIAWFIAIHFGDMSPALRVVVGYGIAAVVAATGSWIARRHARVGHVVLGGGLAVGYFVTYALHFIAAMRMIDAPFAALVLLAAVVAGIVAIGQRLRAETVVGIALLLGLHTSLSFEIRVFTLASTTLLALAAAYLFVRNRWVFVPLSTMIGVYVAHAIATERHAPPDGSPIGLGLLVVYFLVFAGAALSRPASPHPPQTSPAPTLAVAIGNVVLFAAFGAVAVDHQGGSWSLFAALATLLFLGAAAVAWRRELPPLADVHLAAAAPAAAAALGAALPPSAAGPAIALLGAAATRWSARARRPVAAVAVQATLVLALAPFAEGAGAVAPFAIAAALLFATRAWRDVGATRAAEVMRPITAGAAALAGLLGSHAVAGPSLDTLGGLLVAVVLVGLGLAWRDRALRFAALAVVALSAGKLLLFDLARLPTDRRILTFVGSGVILIAVSYAYARLRARLERPL